MKDVKETRAIDSYGMCPLETGRSVCGRWIFHPKREMELLKMLHPLSI